MAFLIFSKNGPEDAFLLGDNQVIIGRAPDCGLTINSNKLSRKHCKIYPGKNVYIVEDLGSANGTLVNGKKIAEPINLNQGDIIRIGDTVAHFSWHPNLTIKKETKAVKSETKGKITYPVLKLLSAPKDVELPKMFTLKPGSYVLGRKPGSDILINFKSVSGKHCKLMVESNSIFVEDLGSTNGTRINNVKISEKTKLSNGDVVQFEKLKYKLEWSGKKVESQDTTKDDLLFVEDEKKISEAAKVEEEKNRLAFIDEDEDEIKLDEPDDIDFEINFDDESTSENERQEAIKMFEEIGHSDQIDVASSDNLEDELKKEVQEFLDDSKKKKRSLKSYTLLFLEIAFVLSAVIVALFLIMQDKGETNPNTVNRVVNPPSDSLITKNWSFEDGIDNSEQELKNWVTNIADSDYVYPEIADKVKSGRACLKIDRNDQTMKQSEVYYAHPIKVDAGNTYALKYAIRNQSNTGAAIMKVAYFSDDAGLNENFIKSEFVGECVRGTEEKWRDVKGITIAPENAKSARIAMTVFGGECIFQFDDIVMQPETVKTNASPEFAEVQIGLYKIRLNSMGMFSIFSENGADEREYLIRDSYWILHHQKNQRPVLLSYFTKNLKVSQNNSENEIRFEGTLLDPIGTAAGTEIPYSVKIRANDDNTINLGIKFDHEIAYSYGIAFYLDEINGELPNAVYANMKNRTVVNYYNLPIKDTYSQQPIPFDSIAIPVRADFLGIDTQFSSNVQADYDESKIRVITKQKGVESAFLIHLGLNTEQIKALNRKIDDAMIQKQTTLAIAYLYELLEYNTHNPTEFRRIQDKINTLSSELLSKKEEFQGILSNLENNPSALLFSHAQTLGNELGKALKNEKFANLELDFNDKFEIFSDSHYYIDEIINKIENLREIIKLIADFEEKYRGKIDYAYMLRAEHKARKLLARAYDYYNEESTSINNSSMAISIFEQIVNLYPFTRPATVARNELVNIAFVLNQKADEIAKDEKELANQYRALAKGLCEKVLNTKFTTAGGETQIYWDKNAKTWTKIAESIIVSFYEIAQAESLNNKGSEEDDFELDEDFAGWDKATWKAKEAAARETLETFIKQIENTITSLPEPTEIPEPEIFGSGDDDDDDETDLDDDDN